MATQKYLTPSNAGFRHLIQLAQMNGNIHNQPRTAQLGGLDKLHESHGYFKNDLALKKPGQTITK